MASIGQVLDIASPLPRLGKTGRERIAIILFLIASAIFLFFDSRVPPVALPDEARNAVNAIEMHVRGLSLVTTFGFQPDLWNTKPPLLIWLMSASMDVFGPSEWALRLPAALAAMGILLCTLLFVRRVGGSLGTAITAAALLLLSPGFFGEHGARTADFDGPLTLFVTAGLQLLFFAIHRNKPSLRSILAIGTLIAAGALTKTIAAFIPVAGVLLYLAVVRRFARTLSQWQRYAGAAATAVLPLLLFYAARDAVAPGYLAAVIHNDIVGRFNEALVEKTTALYYVKELFPGWFIAGPFLIATPLAFARCSSREKLLLLYSASIAGTALVVLSAASSRAVQYALPVFPWLAIMAALTLRYLVQFVVSAWREGKPAQAAVLAAILLLAGGQLTYRAACWRYQLFPARQFYAQATYGDLFAELSARGVAKVTVVDPGVRHLGKPGYSPMLWWNQLIWREKGMAVAHVYAQTAGARGPLATCAPKVLEHWAGPMMERIGSCAVMWRPLNNGDSRA